MNLNLLGFFACIVGNVLTVMLALRNERNAHQRQTEEERDSHKRQLEETLQRMVSEKLDGISGKLSSLERRIGEGEKAHERLLGRLEGAKLLPVDGSR